MPDPTALDLLARAPFHDADDAQRARMISRLADTELAVALVAEPADDAAEIRMFPLEDGQVALACDSEGRLADFLGCEVAYAAMPGRVLAALLRTEGAGLLVNPGHPSEMLLDAAMLDWLQTALQAAPLVDEARLRLTAPRPDTLRDLAEPLAERLGDLRGLIAGAALAGVLPVAGLPAETPPEQASRGARSRGARSDGDMPPGATADGGASPVGGVPATAHVLLIAGAEPDRQPAIAKALAEALAFLPPQQGGVDISFTDAPVPPQALRFDLTPPESPPPTPRPKGPPILR